MSTYIIAKGTIRFKGDVDRKIITEVHNKMSVQDEEFYEVVSYDDEITFEMSGQNGIDYEPLIEIEKFIQEKGIKDFEVSTQEYSEDNDGHNFQMGVFRDE